MNDANSAAAPEPTAPRVVAECRDYRELMQAFRAWFLDDMRVTFTTIDALAGLPQDYTAKLCGPVPVKSIGPISLGPLLGAGGLKILLVVDEEALARIKRHSAFKEADFKVPHSRSGTRCAALDAQVRAAKMRAAKRRRTSFDSDTARIMHARWRLLTSPKQRSEWARAAARIRWANVEARGGD